MFCVSAGDLELLHVDDVSVHGADCQTSSSCCVDAHAVFVSRRLKVLISFTACNHNDRFVTTFDDTFLLLNM